MYYLHVIDQGIFVLEDINDGTDNIAYHSLLSAPVGRRQNIHEGLKRVFNTSWHKDVIVADSSYIMSSEDFEDLVERAAIETL